MLFTVLTMGIVFSSCYMAGKLSTILQIDKIEGRPLNFKIVLAAVLNVILGIYSIIALYGQGIQRGLL